jgi:hypothetical protein
MARKTKYVEIAADGGGRDAGRAYLITEMAAGPAEKWAARAFLALSHAKVDVHPELASLGMVGIFLTSFMAFRDASWEDIEPLLDEMFTCIRACPNPGDRDVTRPLVETDIEEVATRVRLRREALELHAGFTFADALWMMQQRSAAPATTSDQPTFQS